MSNNTFWPEDSENVLYRHGDLTLLYLIQIIVEKWPNTPLEKIIIEPWYVQTKCLGYDGYDSGDYTNFLVIEKRD